MEVSKFEKQYKDCHHNASSYHDGFQQFGLWVLAEHCDGRGVGEHRIRRGAGSGSV